MASSFSCFLLTLPRPLLLSPFSISPPPSSLAPRRLQLSRSNALRVMAQKWEPSRVVPQADRVLVRLDELAEKSSGGVLLPRSAVKFERYLIGQVLSVGAEVGEVEVGKKVDLGGDTKHCFCHARDLLAVVE